MINFDVNDKAVQSQIQKLISDFRALPKDVAKKHMQRSIRKAVKSFEPTLRSNTPYHTGSLTRAIKQKIKVYDKPTHGAVVAVCGYVRGTLEKRRGQFVISGSGQHAIIVEKGTKPRSRKNGGFCGTMPARRMMQNTLSATQSSIISSLTQELAAGLEKAARELESKKNPGRPA